MRKLLLIVGFLALAIGLLWIGQGTGVIDWPPSSFMINQIQWAGYGMVLAEAMARGLPIVCTTGGAAAETVPDDAAIKVQPGGAGSSARGDR